MTDATMLVIRPDGAVERRELPADVQAQLQALHDAIDCRSAEHVKLRDDLSMWVDEDGSFVAEPVVNPAATYLAMHCGLPWQNCAGTVVLTGGPDEDGDIRALPDDAEELAWRAVVRGRTQAVVRDVRGMGERSDRR